MKPRIDRLGRSVATLASLTLLAVPASAVAAQHAPHSRGEIGRAPKPAPHSIGAPYGQGDRIPFTAATVSPASTGKSTVSWTAAGVHRVTVYESATASGAGTAVGFGGADGEITVADLPAASRDWFRLVPDAGASLVLAARDLGFSSDPNFRDIGGYRTTDGQWVKMGVVYRSAALALNPTNLATADTLGITDQFDLRTPDEIAANPDAKLTGATWTNLNVLGTPGVPSSLPASAAAGALELEQGEQSFVTDATSRAEFGDLLDGIANARGAVEVNCSAGKDRTGWATAVLLTLLGVPAPTVLQDYLLSNTYYLDSPAVQAEIDAVPAVDQPILISLASVQPAYLEAGFEQVKQSYGTIYNYVVKGLGVSPRTVAQLRQKLLVGSPTRIG